jgi:hypothetical protein
MQTLKKHDDLKVAVVIDGKPFITIEEGILHESVKNNEALLYIKTINGNKEVKIKISR